MNSSTYGPLGPMPGLSITQSKASRAAASLGSVAARSTIRRENAASSGSSPK